MTDSNSSLQLNQLHLLVKLVSFAATSPQLIPPTRKTHSLVRLVVKRLHFP